jgi:hypothetical protein
MTDGEVMDLIEALSADLEAAKDRIATLEQKLHDHVQADPHPWGHRS